LEDLMAFIFRVKQFGRIFMWEVKSAGVAMA
jgi:hypothetical protein